MIVVDTNILAYRHLAGPFTAQAAALARLDPDWAAPPLWRSEFRNVLAGYIRLGKLTPREAVALMQQGAASLLGGVHIVADVLVFGLVIKSKCTTYDCEFVALAEALEALLVTEDKALLAAFPKRCRSLDHALRHGLAR